MSVTGIAPHSSNAVYACSREYDADLLKRWLNGEGEIRNPATMPWGLVAG